MADFWDCSLWEFSAAVAGWNKAQSGCGDDDAPAMSADTYMKLLEQHGYR